MNTKPMNSRSIYALYILDICITNYIIVYYYIILHYYTPYTSITILEP